MWHLACRLDIVVYHYTVKHPCTASTDVWTADVRWRLLLELFPPNPHMTQWSESMCWVVLHEGVRVLLKISTHQSWDQDSMVDIVVNNFPNKRTKCNVGWNWEEFGIRGAVFKYPIWSSWHNNQFAVLSQHKNPYKITAWFVHQRILESNLKYPIMHYFRVPGQTQS